jgi:hypothetical protein
VKRLRSRGRHRRRPSHCFTAGKGGHDQETTAAIPQLLATAFDIYDRTCRERSQFVVQSSRVVGEIQSWRYEKTGSDTDTIREEMRWRFGKAWTMDVEALVAGALKQYDASVAASGNARGDA